MSQNKNIALLLLLMLVSMFLIPAQAAQNASVNNTTLPANISNATNLSTQEQFTAEQAIETMFLIGIILSPLSFIIAVVALWVAWKNRRQVYMVK